MKKLIESIDRLSEASFPPAGHPDWQLTPAERIKNQNRRVAADSSQGAQDWSNMKEPSITLPKTNNGFVGGVHHQFDESDEDYDDADGEECLSCNGSGKEWDETCLTCGGSGKRFSPYGGYGDSDLGEDLGDVSSCKNVCPRCSGTGEKNGKFCFHCKGSGEIGWEPKSISEGDSDFVYMGAKVQPRGQEDYSKPMTVVHIVSDDTVIVSDEYGNRSKMLIRDLVPHQGVTESTNIREEIAAQFEEFVKNKSIPDEKKSLKIVKKDGGYVVVNEKGVEVKRGDKGECQDYVNKKNRALNDTKLSETTDAKKASIKKKIAAIEAEIKEIGNMGSGNGAGVVSQRKKSLKPLNAKKAALQKELSENYANRKERNHQADLLKATKMSRSDKWEREQAEADKAKADRRAEAEKHEKLECWPQWSPT